MAGDVVRDVDLSVGPLAPLAATAGAGVGVPLGLVAEGDVSLDQFGAVVGADWNTAYSRLQSCWTVSQEAMWRVQQISLTQVLVGSLQKLRHREILWVLLCSVKQEEEEEKFS